MWLIVLTFFLPDNDSSEVMAYSYGKNVLVITLSGSFDEHMEEEFLKIVNKNQNKKDVMISLNSHGGLIAVYESISNILEEMKANGTTITTHVGKNKICMSACTALFAHGDKRMAHTESTWMFHGVYVMGRIGKVVSSTSVGESFIEDGNRVILNAYKSVDEEFAQWLESDVFGSYDYFEKPTQLYHKHAKTFFTIIYNDVDDRCVLC